MRNPCAKALRVKPQQVIPDKREKLLKLSHELQALYPLDADTPADMQALLDQLP